MEYRIRELKVSEIRLLRTFLYEAIYQPSNRDKLPVNIIDTPELYLYIKDWGKANDYCLVLEIANITVGAIWIRFLKNGYGYINDTLLKNVISFFINVCKLKIHAFFKNTC